MSKVVDYFLKYVAFDTQSAEDAGTVPSTEKQFALAKLLSEQLKNIGVKDVSMSEHGYVYGTIPANGDYNCQTVGFLARKFAAMRGGEEPSDVEREDALIFGMSRR